jgi:N-acetylmuramoyl-L-alanine amidase
VSTAARSWSGLDFGPAVSRAPAGDQARPRRASPRVGAFDGRTLVVRVGFVLFLVAAFLWGRPGRTRATAEAAFVAPTTVAWQRDPTRPDPTPVLAAPVVPATPTARATSTPPPTAASTRPVPTVAATSTPVPTATPLPMPIATPVPPTPTQEPVLVFLDPGHGGVDTGTIGTTEDGTQIDEKAVALALARRAAAKLRADGYSVALSRNDDSLPGSVASDYTDGQALTSQGVMNDLQRRIERGNASGAAVMLSIHLNAYTDPSIGGAETFYDSARPFAAASKDFATLVQTNLVAALRANGYDTPDRGVTDDQDLVNETLGSTESYNHLVLLGPAIPGRLNPSQMPGALVEPLFLTDPAEATAAVDPAMQDLIASAFTRAIEQFIRQRAVG